MKIPPHTLNLPLQQPIQTLSIFAISSLTTQKHHLSLLNRHTVGYTPSPPSSNAPFSRQPISSNHQPINKIESKIDFRHIFA
jgi:hypothetical protein